MLEEYMYLYRQGFILINIIEISHGNSIGEAIMRIPYKRSSGLAMF